MNFMVVCQRTLRLFPVGVSFRGPFRHQKQQQSLPMFYSWSRRGRTTRTRTRPPTSRRRPATFGMSLTGHRRIKWTYVVLPKRSYILVENNSKENDDTEDGEAFRAEMERKDFDGVRNNQRSKCDIVRSEEEEHEDNKGMTCSWNTIFRVLSEADCLGRVEQHHQAGRSQEEESTAKPVD